MDTTELVERLRRAKKYEPREHDAWEAADTIERLARERDEAINTLSAWFDLSKKAEEAGADVLRDALETWLRRSLNGGMPSKHADIVRNVVDEAARIYLWNALVPVLRTMADDRVSAAEAERDRLREALKGTAASLVAALAILNRAREANVAPNYVVASDKMFAQMLRDYEASLDVARAALKGDTQ